MRPQPDQLAAIPLFASLSENELAAVARLTELRREDAGVTLVEEGSPGHALFVLLEGIAEASVGGRPAATLAAGDFFGEVALLGEGRRTATITATTPVTLVVMLGSDFRTFERDMPEAAAIMRRAAAERLARTFPGGDVPGAAR